VHGLRLDQIHRERLVQIERLEAAGFHTYHAAAHHTPQVLIAGGRRAAWPVAEVSLSLNGPDVTTPASSRPPVPRSWAPSRSKASFWRWTLSRST